MLALIVLSPIIGALLIMAGAPTRKSALLASFIPLILSLVLFARFRGNGAFQFVTSWPIAPEWHFGLTLGVDGLSLTMLLLASIVTPAAILFASTVERYERAFYICLLLVSAGALGAFASLDLFFFYAFHELALIPTFLLIGIWGTGNRSAAAWKITVYLATGSFVLLLGLILLYQSFPVASRTFDMRDLMHFTGQIPPGAQRSIYLLLLLGFGALVSLFPFHSWAPEAYASAPPAAAMLHAGVLKKFGLYGLLRLAIPLLPEGSHYWSGLLVAMLLGNIIYIGLVTIAQTRLDWMLGYSSVMHMGYIFLGVATANMLGVTGATMLMLAHGLAISLLFAIAGELRKRTGSLAFEDLGGLAKVMPLAGLAFGFAAFAAIGLPGLANFAAELLIFFGAFGKAWEMSRFHLFQVATGLALWGVVISAVYMLRAYRSAFMGPLPDRWKNLADLKQGLRVPVTLLVAGLTYFGFFPQSLVRIVSPAFRTSLSAPSPP